jgi:hypothetical protein
MTTKGLPSSRERIVKFEQIPNVGPRIAADFRKLALAHPHTLAGRDPYALYDRLNDLTGVRQDPCVLDTFIAAVRYMEGAPKRPWWHYTPERKRTLAARVGRPGQ